MLNDFLDLSVRSYSSLELHQKFHAEKKPYEFHKDEIVKSSTVGESEKHEIIFP